MLDGHLNSSQYWANGLCRQWSDQELTWYRYLGSIQSLGVHGEGQLKWGALKVSTEYHGSLDRGRKRQVPYFAHLCGRGHHKQNFYRQVQEGGLRQLARHKTRRVTLQGVRGYFDGIGLRWNSLVWLLDDCNRMDHCLGWLSARLQTQWLLLGAPLAKWRGRKVGGLRTSCALSYGWPRRVQD